MKSLLPTLLAAALLAPAAAHADTVAADPDARQVTALGGTIVWVSGQAPAKLMLRSADGSVSQLSEATAFRAPDLGRDAGNRLVLTYARCTTLTKCAYYRDDLHGKRSKLTLAPRHCAVSSTPAIWRSSVAYGLNCFKNKNGKRVFDAARSGLHLKKGTKRPDRFTAPGKAARAGSLSVGDVDLRGAQVAALYEDVYAFAMVQSTTGSLRYTARVASSEGDGQQVATGVTIGTGDARLWALTLSEYAGSAAQSIIHRVSGAKRCSDFQTISAAGGDELDQPYLDLAVDGGTLYAVDPGVGIVTHAYQPTARC